MASVKVAVRVRPLNQREVDMNSQIVIQMCGKKTSIQNLKIHDAPSGQGDSGRERVKDFTFDHSYWTMDPNEQIYHSQEQVFQDLGVDVIKSGFEGYNACIFAYGQTGSGKTYTMMGKQDDQGLIPRICQGLFLRMKENYEDSTTYRTEVSYLEIYNEHVRDLLRNKNDQSLRVREHPKEGPYVQDLSKHLVVSYSDIKELMDRGNTQRTTASTNMNDTSSRSHAIFTIKFVQAKFNKNMPSETQSKIHLVDLAGSERADATGATGQRLKEGASINKSLVTLGNVISTLAEMSDRKSGKVFIPYRDSVLTWLLKDSLGGNSKTIMIATLSPADVNYTETLSTLRYANRAKNIINKPTVNEDPNVRLIRELREEIARLKAMLGGNLDNITSPRVKERLHENEARVKVLTDEWAGKWKEIQHILEDQTLALRKVQGLGVVLDSDLPHLIGLDDDILSTGIMLFHLKEGITRIGRVDGAVKQDIVLNGLEVESEHCLIDHHNGVVTLQPIEGAFCSVNGVHVSESIVLSQGAVILLGQTNMFRFNHPAQAAKLREEHTKGNLQSRSLMQKASLSQSMTSLVQSTENLASFSPVFELEERHREEMEQLDEKRRLIEEMEQRFQLSENARVQEQTQKEREMEKRREEMRLMQEEMERLKVENEKAKLHIKTEEDRLRRKSMDLEKQKQFFETQRDIQLAHFQEQKEKELEAFEKERLNLQNEKEELGKRIEEEVHKLRVEEERQQRAVEEAKRELAFELEALLQEQEQQKLLNEREQRRLEEQERAQVEELKRMESDIKTKRDSLRKEQQQQMEKLAVERNNLLLLKEQQANAMKLLEDFESTAKESLQAEREKLADTLTKLDSREASINLRYEKLECEVIAKHEDSWNELCGLRKELDAEKKELEVLVEKLNSLSSSDEEYSEISAAVETGSKDVAKKERKLCDKEKDLEAELQKELSDLQAEKQKELKSLEEEKARITNNEDSSETQSNPADVEALKREISEREGHISQATKQLDQLEHSYQESLTKASQEKCEIGQKREELAEKVKQQEEETKLAYESLQRKQTVLEKEAEVESTRIEEQRQRVTQLEQMQQELYTRESGTDTGMGTGDDWSGFEERVNALRQLEDQYQRSERELEEKQRKFESERQQELDRIEMEKYKLQELENQERINALVEQEVKRRLFEEKVQREKQRRMEREQERQEREMEMEKMKRAHDKEIKRLKQRYNDLTASMPAPVKTRANPYASIQNTDAELVVDQERKVGRSLSQCRCDNIHVCIPSYTLRGNGSDCHHEFEVKVIIGHECWTVYRRYKRFRELHSFMKSKYPELGKLVFPARKLFGRHSEKFVSERKTQLEHYLQSFIEVLQNDPNSFLHRSQNKGLSKQLLCEFLPFFKKGVFETSKHNTS